MNYYYDILVNLQEVFYEFYEWEKTDNILAVKKTPLFRVNHQTVVDFLTYEISLDQDFINNIWEKTICKRSKEKISAFLISDCKTSLFLEVNGEGKVIFRSKLLVEDENNVNEIVNALKEVELNYQIEEKVVKNNLLRRTIKEQKLIMAELNSLRIKENVDKCNYLYYELFHEIPDNYDEALDKMQEFILSHSRQIHSLAHLIDISYQEKL